MLFQGPDNYRDGTGKQFIQGGNDIFVQPYKAFLLTVILVTRFTHCRDYTIYSPFHHTLLEILNF